MLPARKKERGSSQSAVRIYGRLLWPCGLCPMPSCVYTSSVMISALVSYSLSSLLYMCSIYPRGVHKNTAGNWPAAIGGNYISSLLSQLELYHNGLLTFTDIFSKPSWYLRNICRSDKCTSSEIDPKSMPPTHRMEMISPSISSRL